MALYDQKLGRLSAAMSGMECWIIAEILLYWSESIAVEC